MILMTRIARLVGPHRVAVAVTAVAVMVVAAGTTTALLLAAPGDVWSAGNRGELLHVDVPDDSDGDGLSDAQENLLGSDPRNPHTLGRGVPDGWVHRMYGLAVDWSDGGILDAPALVPPSDALPGPLRRAEALILPAVHEVYKVDAARADELGVGGAWWLHIGILDPLEWDGNGDGVADAWLVQHHMHPFDAELDAAAPGDGALLLRQKYERGLDPWSRDSDNDGLLDVEEISGSARFGSMEQRFTPTDPSVFSQRGDGIADGFLVRFGLDPHDPAVARTIPSPGGLSVAEAFDATLDHCASGTSTCDWTQRLRQGPLVDPTGWDSSGDGVPDAWSWRDPASRLHPLDDARKITLSDTAVWDGSVWGGNVLDLRGVVVDPANPALEAPAMVSGSAAYSYLRPSTWDESMAGPWRGGIPPSHQDFPSRLPAAVALRGWNLTVDVGLGGIPDLRTIHVSSNPMHDDTDADGIPDIEEYFGVISGEAWVRADPASPDTDGDDLRDVEEAPLGTDPLRRDTSGSFLTDGQEHAYWTQRYEEAVLAFKTDPVAATLAYAWLADASGHLNIERLRPEGTLDGTTSNILSADTDGDGLLDGAELFPNQFLPSGGAITRPATDPARIDTDGDTLPDWWEVAWSQNRYAGCQDSCKHPGGRQLGDHEWPIDPSKENSFDMVDGSTDADLNLNGDEITTVSPRATFSNQLAYKYDLNPYAGTTASGDGLPDLFSIHWGIENVPDFAITAIEQDLATNSGAVLGWTVANMDRISTGLTKRGFPPLNAPAVIDPTTPNALVHTGTDLLSVFAGREKGVWRVGDPCMSPFPLPSSGPRAEDLPRAGLVACWVWESYTLGLDVMHQTDPWRHDHDGDGLPDAWELAYTGSPFGANPGSIIPSALADGCEGRLGDGPHCLTIIDAFLQGLDPTVLDTDGGGNPDWLEIALGFDPLDPLDDAGEEDWDWDGLINARENEVGANPLHPDSDGDGLADGGDLTRTGRGRGNLCIAPDDVTTAPNMGRRPGGPLTFQELHAWYIELGVLRDMREGNGCPSGMTLFMSEGIFDPGSGIYEGAGKGTDPLRWDTSGDGLPDGWVVFWREEAQDSNVRGAMDPHKNIASVAFEDFIPLSTSYQHGRPADWSEGSDGPWWGGLDPTRVDTDGDSGWFEQRRRGEDSFERELDNDGLIGLDDPNHISAANADLAVWRDAGGYRTDGARIFDEIRSRHGSMSNDLDADRIPDALDRVRIRVDASAQSSQVDKSGSVLVTGSVTVDDASSGSGYADLRQHTDHATDGVGVEGATVLVLAVGGNMEVLLGYGFTGDDGLFDVTASFGGLASGPPAPGAAVVAGNIVEAGQTMAIPTASNALAAGPLQIVVVVQANDPAVQALAFGEHTHVEAFKTATNGLYTPPGQQSALKAVVMDAGGLPVTPAQSVRHTTSAIFAARSSPVSVDLLASAVLEVDTPTEPVFAADVFAVSGTLSDNTGTPLAGMAVTIFLQKDGQSRQVTKQTDADGGFDAAISTTGMTHGPAQLRVEVDVGQGAYLLPPDNDPLIVWIARQSSWSDVVVAGQAVQNSGVLIDIEDPAAQVVVQGRLKDHLGQTVTSWPVKATLSSVDDTLITVSGVTDSQGMAEFSFLVPPGAPLQDLELRLTGVFPPQDFGVAEFHTSFPVFLRPRFATQIVVTDAEADAGGAGTISGRLLRSGHPIESQDMVFVALSADKVASATGTDDNGAFHIPVPASTAGVREWAVLFVGSRHLHPSPTLAVNVTHVGHPVLDVVIAPSLRDQDVNVTGAFSIPEGGALEGHAVRIGWADGQAWISATTDGEGNFSAEIPGRGTPGDHMVRVEFLGDQHLRPASVQVAARVLASTVLEAVAANITVAPDGSSLGHLLQGTLVDDLDTPLASRPVAVEVTLPDGGVQVVERVTDTAGRFTLAHTLIEGRQAGLHAFNVTYAGRTFEAPSLSETNATVTRQVRVDIERMPGAIEAGAAFYARGRLVGAVDVGDAVPLSVTLGGQTVAEVAALPGQAWSLQAKPAALPNGTYLLEVVPDTPPDLEGVKAIRTVQVFSAIHVRLEIVGADGGGRQVTITLSGPAGQALSDVKIDLIRVSEEGLFLGRHSAVTDSTATALLDLGKGETGEVVVVGLVADGLFLNSQDVTMGSYMVQIPDSRSYVGAWIAALVTALACVALAGTYWMWRRHQMAAIAQAIDEGHRLVLSGNLPVAEAIRRMYDSLLEILRADIGYEPPEEATVRDIAEAATRVFRLPARPMKELTKLFEAARYGADEPLDRGRKVALKALRQISLHAGARVRLVRGGGS